MRKKLIRIFLFWYRSSGQKTGCFSFFYAVFGEKQGCNAYSINLTFRLFFSILGANPNHTLMTFTRGTVTRTPEIANLPFGDNFFNN